MIGGLDEGLRVHCLAMRPGKYDRKHEFLIQFAELRELKELDLPESFGLDRRIERYQGKRPLGLYRWDLDGVLAPAFCPLEGYEWLLLISGHSARHTAQIGEVKFRSKLPERLESSEEPGIIKPATKKLCW